MLFLDRISSITVVGQSTFNNLTKRWIKQILTVPLTYLDVMIFFFFLPSLWTNLWRHHAVLVVLHSVTRAKTAVFCVSYILLDWQNSLCFLYIYSHKNLPRCRPKSPTNLSTRYSKSLYFSKLNENSLSVFLHGQWQKIILHWISLYTLPNSSPFIYLFMYTVNGLATWMSLSEMNLSYNFSEVREVVWRMAPLQLDFKTLFYFAPMPTDFFWKFS